MHSIMVVPHPGELYCTAREESTVSFSGLGFVQGPTGLGIWSKEKIHDYDFWMAPELRARDLSPSFSRSCQLAWYVPTQYPGKLI